MVKYLNYFREMMEEYARCMLFTRTPDLESRRISTPEKIILQLKDLPIDWFYLYQLMIKTLTNLNSYINQLLTKTRIKLWYFSFSFGGRSVSLKL